MTLAWTQDLAIGIPVIDGQHQRIVEYINQLDMLKHDAASAEVVADVLQNLVDYTLSHFAFEETLMEEAGYPFINAHKKVHQLFARRVGSFQELARSGEDITDELLHTLKAWLVNHIKRDDKDYTAVVRANLEGATERVKAKKGGLFSRLFS